MPFELTQTLFRVTVPEYKEIKRRAQEKPQDIHVVLVEDEERLCGCLWIVVRLLFMASVLVKLGT